MGEKEALAYLSMMDRKERIVVAHLTPSSDPLKVDELTLAQFSFKGDFVPFADRQTPPF